MNKQVRTYLWLILGSLLLLGTGWRWNVPFAMWLAPVFLIRFFRSQERWCGTLAAIPLTSLAMFANITGGWDFTVVEELGVGLARAVPFLVALYADRFFAHRGRPLLASLAYPAAYVVIDYAIGLTPLGTVFSVAATQFDQTVFIQLAAVTGIWGLGFMIGWTAAVINYVWEQEFDLRQAGAAPLICGGVLSATLILGGLRIVLTAPGEETVKIASITVEHTRDYWGEIIDQGTPTGTAGQYQAELDALIERLFGESQRTAEYGAQIVFWSEGNAILYPEEVEAFLARSQQFAQENEIYFMPTYVGLRYGEMTADNMAVMIAPNGEIAYKYAKTKSWYPTNSDGILPVIETPYGILSTAICFDMDFPAFINRAAKQNVDIMLVPAFDWEPIKPYHTKVGLLRGIENGFSVVRQVNEGASIAIDYKGNVLAYQDFFETSDPVMMVDVPIRGTNTLYGLLGDWFVYLNMAILISLTGLGILRSRSGDSPS
ncbi:MAG: hypothetical protein JXB30_12815 [Anaerolineae bacterium]|nr:hypothetical protein [Anaerolineae bacterium]